MASAPCLRLNPALAAASACMRPELVLPAACSWLLAVCSALMTGLVMASVSPLCLNFCSVLWLPVSLASLMVKITSVLRPFVIRHQRRATLAALSWKQQYTRCPCLPALWWITAPRTTIGVNDQQPQCVRNNEMKKFIPFWECPERINAQVQN